MFILHSSNKTENLFAHLLAILDNAPLSNPFAEEIFLIQSQGMERWLSQQLACEFNVWGNYQFLFPGKFFSSLAQRLDTRLNDEAFDRQLMLWRFEAVLRNLDDDVFKPLQHYLSGENIALKCIQLAQQLSQLFDQYQIMRPDMLACWQQGQTLYGTTAEYWQRALWQKITETTGNKHRGALWLDLIDKFNNAETGFLQPYLPERVSIFGLHSLPPLFLDYLQGLSRHCDVHFYLLNPAQVFWGDVPGKKLRAQLEDFDGHPLLSTLGQQGREFQQMILEQMQFELELDSFEETPASNNPNNLQQLQNDILANQQPDIALQNDGSICIHACHSRMREVEVIKNQLLAALENDSQLELRDIVVMAPDIQVYEPFIAAVFDDIQHAVADRSLRLSNTCLDTFIRFLRLSQSRFGWQSVLDLLEQPLVYGRFELSEADLDLIRYWTSDTRVRWGQSAEHKQELDLPPLSENTWQAALDRLLMGYAVGNDDAFVNGVLPYIHIEGSSAQALGGLHDFLQMLFKAAHELKHDQSLSEWSQLLFRYADELLAETDALERQQLNELLLDLGEHYASVHELPLSLDVIISWLEGMVSERKSSNGFLRGQLTFCSMLPMRSIPFKVIVLLGMNDSEFPKLDRQPTFDLMSQNFRPGDRSRRADDRYQFLEILLSARQQLIISYIGQSIQQNDEIPPSVIVSELLDVLAENYQLNNLIVRHPLQAFSVRYFDHSDERLFSYVQSDCETAMQLHKDKTQIASWWQGEIAVEQPEVIDIAEMFAFFRHPQRYFMQRQLGLRFHGSELEPQEREPFTLDFLDNYSIQQEWIECEWHDGSLSLPKLQAQGRWLPGTPGQLEYVRQQPAIQQFVEQIRSKALGEALPDKVIDIEFRGLRLTGKLTHLYQNGSLIYRYSTLKGKDFINAWLHHLLINQMLEQDTWLLSSDYDLCFKPQENTALQALIELFLQGQQRPDVFFTEASFHYCQQAAKAKASNRKMTDPLLFTQNKMAECIEKTYEAELKLLFNTPETLTTVFNQDFEQQCQTLLLPIWEAVNAD